LRIWLIFFFSSRRRHTRFSRDWSSDVCSSDLDNQPFLIHFTGRKPIYLTYNYRQDYKDLFFEYLEQTPWKGYKQIGETTRYLKRSEERRVGKERRYGGDQDKEETERQRRGEEV